MRASRFLSLRPLFSAGVLAAGVLAFAASAAGQATPDDEPLPPAIARPPTAPPPAPTTPPPAPTTPPAPVPPPLPAAPPPAAPPAAAAPAPEPTPYDTSPPVKLQTRAAPPARAGAVEKVDPTTQLTSLTGQIGLYRVSTAEVGQVGHLRFGLHGQYFTANRFLLEGSDMMGDTNTRFSGTFTFGFTPHQYVELFGGIMSSSNRNVRAPEENRRDPELIKSFGDLVLGGKGSAPVGRGFRAGAELGFRFLSSISDLSVSPSSTSLWIGPVATVDLQQLAGAPLRFHANLNYYLDNSANLYDFSNTTRPTREVAMFAYGIAASRLRMAVGVDAPLERFTAPVPIRPFAEYHAEIVTASPDPAFAGIDGDTRNRDQHWLTFGVRVGVYRGLTLDTGIDVGLRSVGYEFGPPLPPWDWIFGIGYPFDAASFARPVVVTKTVEKVPEPSMGTIVGNVKNKEDGKPIAEAVVSFGGQPRARVATDPDGSFQSVPLPPGSVEITIAAAGFEPAQGTTKIVAGSASTVEVALLPKIVNGNVRGKVSDRAGKGLPATIRFNGPKNFEARADVNGVYSAVVPAGPYRVVVESTGYPAKEVPLEVTAGQDRNFDVTLRPANPDVSLTPQAIVLRVPIKFRSGTPKLTPAIKAELETVADILVDHPEIKTLRVEAHWSGVRKGKAADAAKALTLKQATAVKEFLVAKGAPADRIETVGAGGEAPLVPNLGPANQAKNRRVELVVVQ